MPYVGNTHIQYCKNGEILVFRVGVVRVLAPVSPRVHRFTLIAVRVGRILIAATAVLATSAVAAAVTSHWAILACCAVLAVAAAAFGAAAWRTGLDSLHGEGRYVYLAPAARAALDAELQRYPHLGSDVTGDAVWELTCHLAGKPEYRSGW